MLSYKVKLNGSYINKDEVVWGERYLSPDLSFVSGVTSQDYHLEGLTKIEASMDGKTDLLTIQCENVTREGYVIVKNKRYKTDGSTVMINGQYYQIKNNAVTVDNWLVQKYGVKKDYNSETGEYDTHYFVPGVTTETKTFTKSGNYILADTIFWIENGKVNIDGNDYFFDRDEVTTTSKGCLKYFEDGGCLSGPEVTDCSSIEFYPIEKSTDFIDITKFILTKEDDRSVEIDNVTYVSHFYYILYNDKYYPITLNSDGTYVCDIDGHEYEVVSDYHNPTTSVLTSSIVLDYEALGDYMCYVALSDECLIKVEETVQSANNGRKIGIYLKDIYDNIKVSDIITARKKMDGDSLLEIEFLDDGTAFALHDGSRYDVVADMMSTVVINDVEYEIKRCDDTNCFVEIDGEEVPMKKNGNTLTRYGYIVKNDNKITESYTIKNYSGITMEGKDYRIIPMYMHDSEGTNVLMGYTFSAEPGIVHRLVVTEVIGSSLLVCEPELFTGEFDQDYINAKISEIAGDVVFHHDDMVFYKKNTLFGDRETLPQNEKVFSDNEYSPSEYVFPIDKLILYANIGYISIPIKLEAGMEVNHLIDDTRDRDFVEVEEQKAINPIIDMEKDVYTPKYIENSEESIAAFREAVGMDGTDDEEDEDLVHAYIGSFTDFKPITEIQINPHFRTRNLDNWKVNDGYNDSSTSGKTDNWFITDYEPYKTILKEGTYELESVSDVLGLLYFSNMDIFYQKTAVAKTFLRLSYYDGTNPQTQTLLGYSTVFVDEHDLFKKFIDNSRKNVNDYMFVQEPSEEEHIEDEEEEEEEFVYEIHPSILNKISVMSEYIGKHNKSKNKPTEDGYKFTDAKPLEEGNRISSRFTIVNKYETDTSSEGFYMYIFKQYAENLHPKPIYMKIDFNHAKIGKTIPFNIPMLWEKSKDESDDSPYVYPVRKLTLSDTSVGEEKSDLEMMKEGIPLSYVYGQGYIPLYAMYDFKNKEYVYIFDERYVTVEDGLAQLNVFELKVKNNEDGSIIEKTAAIDINDKQIIVK